MRQSYKSKSYFEDQFPDGETELKPCDRPGCSERGECRAPKSPQNLKEYYWFCRAHAREYNESWDFYRGMNYDQIEQQVQFDATWQRPSWPMGVKGRRKYSTRPIFDDPFEFLGGLAQELAANEEEVFFSALSLEERKAMRLLNVDPPFTAERIKAKYKELAKRHHPDANGGDKLAEEKLKSINQAYAILKKSFTT